MNNYKLIVLFISLLVTLSLSTVNLVSAKEKKISERPRWAIKQNQTP